MTKSTIKTLIAMLAELEITRELSNSEKMARKELFQELQEIQNEQIH